MEEHINHPSTPDRVFSRSLAPQWQTPTPPRHLSTPPSSSSSKRPVHNDRYIPNRSTTNLEDAFDILENKMSYLENNQRVDNVHDNRSLMNSLLRAELLGDDSLPMMMDTSIHSQSSHAAKRESGSSSSSHLFKYRSSSVGSKSSIESGSSLIGDIDSLSSNGSIGSPARRSSFGTSGSGRSVRKIPKTSFKTLDAPSLQDDYYLNLLDWSPKNVLAVALSNAVYLWSASTAKVAKLLEFDPDSGETVTSIAWCQHNPQLLAVGTSHGRIYIWDAVEAKMLRELRRHDSRVGALSWSSPLLASGSRDRTIYLQDVRHVTHGHSANSSTSGSYTGPGSARVRRHSMGSQGTPVGSLRPSPMATPPRMSTGSGAMDFPGDPVGISPMLPPPPLQLPLPLSATLPMSLSEETTVPSVTPLSPPLTSSSLFSSSSSRLQAIRSIFSPPELPSWSDISGHSAMSVDSPLVPPPLLSSLSTATAPHTASSSSSSGVVAILRAHTQEVCGLKWSFDEKYLASGGNDNKLFVWDSARLSSSDSTASSTAAGSSTPMSITQPLHRFEEHTAAVKAVAWSPHQPGLLASGGGTADRHIRFWNVNTGLPLHKIDTCSQVCNLMWSKTVNEIVSTHGYSLNQVMVWKYPSMQKLATLTGHTMRVLYLAMSPDGQTVVTGAGDETLRFWNIFPPPRSRHGVNIGQTALLPSTSDVR